MSKTLYLIDGHAQMFRCYYAPFRDLSSPTGEPTKATYVFSQMLLSLIREKKPTHLAMVIDLAGKKTFRDEIYADYKANREPPPEDFAPQEKRILQIVEAAGVPVLSLPGFEADDVIATLVERARGRDVDVYLVSKDKDLEQLLSDRVRMYDPNKDEVIDVERMLREKGYGPQQAIEVQTLTGDTIDNVPGVKGVGPKTAAKLIAKYGTAEEVVRHADELTPAQRANVLAFAEQVPLSRKLVTLRRDVPLEVRIEDLRFETLRVEAIRPIFEELGFSRILPQLDALVECGLSETAAASERPHSIPSRPHSGPCEAPKSGPIPDSLFAAIEPGQSANAGATGSLSARALSGKPPVAPGESARYELVDTPERFDEFLAKLRQQGRFAFDTETTSVDAMSAELVGMSFAWKAGEAYYLAFRGIAEHLLDCRQTLERLRPILEDEQIRKVGQNAKYDMTVVNQHGVPVRGIDFDTMIASFVLDSTRRSHGIDALSMELFGHRKIATSELLGTGRNQLRMDQVETRRVSEYACEDADFAWRLYEAFAPQLAASGLEKLFRETEMPLVEVLAEMEQNGVTLDTDILAKMSNGIAGRLRELTEQIHAAVGHPFNIDSTKQLADVLFDELGLRIVRRTKTARSTDAETLETLVYETGHEVPRLLLEYRELIKLKNTYIDTLPEMINEKTGRVHASFNQIGAVTGRLSSSDPNLQNIPIRTEMGRQIRKAFVPSDKDHVLLTADYSQIELRVMAHFCKDEALVRAFAEGQDIHAFVASQVFDVPLAEVTKEQRSRAKTVNFGIIYGQGPQGLSRQTGISVPEAKKFIERYFARYPGIRRFIDHCVAQAKSEGYVHTILGRRRRIEDIHSQNRMRAAAAERFAVNTVIQGSAADLIKRAMINIHRRLHRENRPSKMLIQVHDELVFEVPRRAAEAEAEMIRHEMTHALPLDVPIQVDINWGDNWLEGK
jgi:DNA polymerase-1